MLRFLSTRGIVFQLSKDLIGYHLVEEIPLILKLTSPIALKVGGNTIGISLVVFILHVATLVPALDPM